MLGPVRDVCFPVQVLVLSPSCMLASACLAFKG